MSTQHSAHRTCTRCEFTCALGLCERVGPGRALVAREPFLPYRHKRSRKAQSLDERLEGHDLVVEELLEFLLVQLLVCDWVTRA